MIARVADHCFWLGRYLERSESAARTLQVTGTWSLDAELAPRRCWHPVVIVSGQEADFVERFGKDALDDAEAVQRYLARDLDNPVSLWRSVSALRENARSIRDVLSLEVWQVVNELALFVASDEADAMYRRQRHALYARVQRSTQLGLGLLRSTMLHDDPLDFIWLGVMLERIGQTARLIDVQHHAHEQDDAPHPVLEIARWLSLLRACSGSEAFMKRSRGRIDGPTVASFLVLEPRFPRSIVYCVRASRERLEGMCAGGEVAGARAVLRLRELESYLDDLAAVSGLYVRVHEVLTHVVGEVHAACALIETDILGTRVAPAQSQSQSQT